MAIEHVTFTKTHQMTSYQGTTVVPGEIPFGVSMVVALTLLDFDGTALDCTGATCTMKGRPRDSEIAEITLGTGAVSGTGNNVITFTVNKDTIPEGWSLYPNLVRISWNVENGAGEQLARVFQENITVISDQDPDDIEYPYTEDIFVNPETVAVDTAMTGTPGWQVLLVNTAGGVKAITLPATGTYDGQVVEIIVIGANNATVTPEGVGETINGATGAQTFRQWDGGRFTEYSGNWVYSNPSVVVP